MRVHVVLESKQVRRNLVFAAPTVAAEPVGPGRLREVDTLYKLILVHNAPLSRFVVVCDQAWIQVGRRIEFEQFLGNRTDPIASDDVAGKWITNHSARSGRIRMR